MKKGNCVFPTKRSDAGLLPQQRLHCGESEIYDPHPGMHGNECADALHRGHLRGKDEPYFGAYRGRYSAAEIREMDDYAQKFGVELVPCIQTLAHLHNALKWPVGGEDQRHCRHPSGRKGRNLSVHRKDAEICKRSFSY